MPDQISHANSLNNFHKSAVMATDVTHTEEGGWVESKIALSSAAAV